VLSVWEVCVNQKARKQARPVSDMPSPVTRSGHRLALMCLSLLCFVEFCLSCGVSFVNN
jgi:hypothetical protein